MATSVIIGIAGGTASGKSTLTRRLLAAVPHGAVSLVEHDWYYHCMAHRSREERATNNFDHPDSLETSLLVEHLRHLRNGVAVDAPSYDYRECARLGPGNHIEPRPVVVVEGILAFTDSSLRESFDLRVFVDAPADLRLSRRIVRDTEERGWTPTRVVGHYQSCIRDMHAQFVEPSRRHAHLVVPGERDFEPVVAVLAAYIEKAAR